MNVAARPTLKDVAAAAGVSAATVDRVLNGRTGVRQPTVSRVQEAVARLKYRPDPAATRLARKSAARLCFILPVGETGFAQLLSGQVGRAAEWLDAQRATIETDRVDVFNPTALINALQKARTGFDGVATVALDHPAVRAAIDDLVTAGIPVVTLVSDAPSSRRAHYVGVDNAAAGRTAATLLGRFVGPRLGAVGVIAGSLALRDHSDRQFGFAQALHDAFPQLNVLPVEQGQDDPERNEAITARILAQTPNLLGLYNVGAGNRGVIKALEASGRSHEVVYIGHELTSPNREALRRGTMDACINQDAGHEVRSAARVLLARCLSEPLLPDQERIRIDIYVRDNMP